MRRRLRRLLPDLRTYADSLDGYHDARELITVKAVILALEGVLLEEVRDGRAA